MLTCDSKYFATKTTKFHGYKFTLLELVQRSSPKTKKKNTNKKVAERSKLGPWTKISSSQ
jgi:hypothetical protein